MEPVAVRLLALDILEAESPEIQERIGLRSRDASLLRYRPDGPLRGVSALWKLERIVPDFWKNKVVSIYVQELHFDLGREYPTWLYTVELRPDSLPELVKDKVEYDKQVHSLLEAAFLSDPEGRTESHSFRPRFSSILYVEPGVALAPGRSYEAIEAAAIDALSLLWHGTELACTPYLLKDTLLMMGIGLGKTHEEATAVSLEPLRLRADDGELVTSQVVHDLAIFMAAARILAHLHRRLKALPFCGQTLDQYMQKLAAKSDQTRNVLLGAYESVFLADRQKSIEERHSVMHSLKVIESKIENNYILLAPSLQESLPIHTTSRHPYRYNFLEALRDNFADSVRELREISELILARETALADYLRDKTAAEATRSNLRLQRTVEGITWAALVVAIVALLIGLLTDDLKRLIIEKLISVSKDRL